MAALDFHWTLGSEWDPVEIEINEGAFVLEPYITVHTFGFSNRGMIQIRIVIEEIKPEL